MTRTIGLSSLLAVLACNGPVGLMAGGALEGEPTVVPGQWSFARDYGTAQLETRPREPYSVNIAYTLVEGVLYVNAGDSETQWVKNISEDPRVRLRVGDAIYELRAERVTDEDEISRFAKAWTSQSLFRRDPTGLDRVYLYRLVAR